jgi:hypothetical protein
VGGFAKWQAARTIEFRRPLHPYRN